MARARLAALLGGMLALAAAGALASPPSDPSALAPYPAERLLPFWRQYSAQYEDGPVPFMPAYRLDPAPAGADSPSGFWLEASDGQLIAIGVDPDGYLRLPGEAHAAGFVSRATRILHDSTGPLPAIRLEIHLRAASAGRYAVADLAAAVSAMDRFQRSAMGFAALMAPRFDVVVFRFDGPAPDGWHVTPDGRRTPLAALHDTLSVRMTGRLARTGGYVELAAPPRRIVLEAR